MDQKKAGLVRSCWLKLSYRLALASLVLLSLIGLAVPQTAAQEKQSGESSVLSKVRSRLYTQGACKMSFDSINYDAFNQETMRAKGELYHLDGLLRFEYLSPEKQTIVLGKDKVSIYDPALNSYTVSQLSKVSGLDSLVFLRQGKDLIDYKPVAKSPWNVLKPEPKTNLLFLINQKKGSVVAGVEVRYDQDSFLLREIAMIDKQDNLRTMKLSDCAPQKNITRDFFSLTPPKNAEIIEY